MSIFIAHQRLITYKRGHGPKFHQIKPYKTGKTFIVCSVYVITGTLLLLVFVLLPPLSQSYGLTVDWQSAFIGTARDHFLQAGWMSPVTCISGVGTYRAGCRNGQLSRTSKKAALTWRKCS